MKRLCLSVVFVLLFVTSTLAKDAPWQKIALKNAGVIHVPASWIIVTKNSTPTTQAFPEGIMYIQECLSMRTEDMSSQENPAFKVGATWGFAHLITNDDELEEFNIGMTEAGLAEANVPVRSIKKERYYSGSQNIPILTYEIELAADYILREKRATLRHQDKLLSLQAVYMKQSEKAWDTRFKSILSRWEIDVKPLSTTPATKSSTMATTSKASSSPTQTLAAGLGSLIPLIALYYILRPKLKGYFKEPFAGATRKN